MTRTVSVKTAIKEALVEEMTVDNKVIYIGEDASYGGSRCVCEGLAGLFPERVIDTPISEAAILGSAVGMALKGYIPVVDFRCSSFLLVAYDQLVHCAAQMRYLCGGKVNIPLVIWSVTGGRWGMGPHHSENIEALTLGIPGIKVAVPSSPNTAKALLKASINDPNPVLFFEPIALTGMDEVENSNLVVELGKARSVKTGDDLSVITYGYGVTIATEVAGELEKQGISIDIIDLLTLQPLDIAAITRSAEKTGRVIVLEDAWKKAGIGSEICTIIAENLPGTLVRRVAAEEVPVPASLELEKMVLPQQEDLVRAVKELMARKILLRRVVN